MRFISLLTVLMLATSQASALSCMRSDVAQTFTTLNEAEERYIVLMGSFAYDPALGQTEQGASFPAQFSGQVLGAAGFMQTAPTDVTVVLSCAGPWCGAMPAQNTVTLAFVEVTDDDYVLDVGPCYGSIFSPPSIDDIRRLETCMRGGPCEPSRVLR